MYNNYFTVSEQYKEKFYQLPKVFFTNPDYMKLSNDAKIAYAILRDRLELSIQNNWIDQDGNIYFIYTVKQLEDILNCGNQKVNKIKKELEKVNLLIQKRQGLNKPNLLYLMKPEIKESDIYTISLEEKASNSMQDKEMLNSHVRKCENHTSENVKITRQDVLNSHANDTELSDTELSDTELSDTNDLNDTNTIKSKANIVSHSSHSNHQSLTSNILSEQEEKQYELQEFPEHLSKYIMNYSVPEVRIIKSVLLKAKRSFHDERSAEIELPYTLEDIEQELIEVLKRFKFILNKKNESVKSMQSYLLRCVKTEFEEIHVLTKRQQNIPKNNMFGL
ncbi:replication initiator protein A [Staphylococcus epidermidis]|uniref:replication initiator protein A n=1 Tax=Staphylococcus epidermidis TaxID=1282 RepID=UPI002DBB179E|nr:replication initiator protein A [Staphylococcus epidermidis]MEB7347495.1 replication initiator protein A [Staphylococcus epidermidis]